jgi:HK97 family phage prohead protease
MNNLNIRSCNIRAEINNEDKKVKFYYLTYNFRNDYGEIFLPGSSARTQKEDGDRVKYFKNHDRTLAPGIVLKLGEDLTGAYAEAKIIDTTLGRDTWVEYIEGQITEHSFGFRYTNGMSYDKETDTIILSDYMLKEVSALNGWGADKNTSVIQLNSGQSIERIEFIKQIKGEQNNINLGNIINHFKNVQL